MQLSSSSTRATRPAILIAHGGFGRSAVKRLLVGAALRGRLVWRAGGGGDDERRLRDVGILWWPDEEDAGAVSIDGSSGLELMRDLDRQIETVEDVEENLADAVERVAARLLSAAERMRQGDALPLGLDVFVLARPRRAETVGRFDRVLQPALERLSSKKVLRRGVQGADKLGFLQILDFDDYWRPDAEAGRLREALAASASRWREKAQAKQPAFGRIYLIDGQTEDGVKFAKDRLDEVVLFLELLLFEGLRDGNLQHLYQRQRDGEAPIATFGVRVFERSSGLLRRLAAARFALDWLEHLDGADPIAGAPSSLDELLSPLEGAGLEKYLAFDRLEEPVERAFAELEGELVSLTPERPDWSQEIERRYRSASEQLERRLDAELTSLLAEKARWLDDLPSALGRAADEDLGATNERDLPRRTHPLSARVELEKLEAWRRRLVPSGGARASDDGAERAALDGLEHLAERYRSFRLDQVEASALRAFWPLWAAALACAGAPGLLDLLRTIPAPDPNNAHHLLVWAHGLFERALGPLSVSLTLLLGGLAAGLLLAQPRLARGVERGRRFFNDPHRGRIADRLRRELASGGGLRAPVEARLAAAAADREAGVRGRLVREIDRLIRRLRRRRREIGWLRDQLAELLRVHGLGPEAGRDDGQKLQPGSGVRQAAERVGDVRRLLSSNPPGPERFRSMQSSERPLAGWREADAGVFLRPLEFLDELSRRFHDPGDHDPGRNDPGGQAGGRPGAGPGRAPVGEADAADLLEFIDRHHHFELSFPWHGSDEVPVDEPLCLLPRELFVAEVGRRLREIGISDERWHEIEDAARVYLLRVQIGVRPERLRGARRAGGGQPSGSER